MRLDSSVNLLVASLDLKLVRLVRAAMRAADEQGTCGCRKLIHPAPAFEPRVHYHPEPVFEPRPHVHPTPAFEPRPRLHGRDGLEPCCPPPTCVEPVERKSSTSPIQPPWKVLPWENPPEVRPRPSQKVKLLIGRPDIVPKGNVIDVFI